MPKSTMAVTSAANRRSLHSLASVKTARRDPKKTSTQDVRSSVHSQHDTARSSALVDDSWPVHPISSMQGPFQESIVEAMDPDARIRQTLDAATRRLQLMQLDNPNEEDYSSRWRRKPGAKFHPLWKLIAQISFGIHLLHQEIAKSEEEVIRILQTHVDEIDSFLEDVGADFDAAMRDIDDRLRLLLLPLEHGRTFSRMLRNHAFRTSIIEGNDIIERICSRTKIALDKSVEDVQQGLEATAELAKFLDRLGKEWTQRDEDMEVVYTAMRGNAEGWYCAFGDIQKKGEKLKKMIRRLERIVSEVERQAGIASRRETRKLKAASELPEDQKSSGKISFKTSKVPSITTSPPHSPAVSAWRASLNKPLPPDPHRRFSKPISSHSHKPSVSRSHSGQVSQDVRDAVVEPSGSVKSASGTLPASKIAAHPAQSSATDLHNVPARGLPHGFTNGAQSEPEVRAATNEPLPLNPLCASGPFDASQIQLPLSPQELPASHVPLPLSPTRSSPGSDRVMAAAGRVEEVNATSTATQESIQGSAPIAQAGSQPEPTDATEAVPQDIAKHVPVSSMEVHDQAKDAPRQSSDAEGGEAMSPPTLTHTGTTASESSIQHVPVRQSVEEAENISEPQQASQAHFIKPTKSVQRFGRGVPARVPVGRKASGPKLEETKEGPAPPREILIDTVKTTQQPAAENEPAKIAELEATDPIQALKASSEQSFKTAERDPESKEAAPEKVEDVSASGPKGALTAPSADSKRVSKASTLQKRHSIASIVSSAHDSTAVERHLSQPSEEKAFPKRTVSMNAFGPTTGGLGNSNLPEIEHEPTSPPATRTSNEASTTMSTPSTPPLPQRSAARSPPQASIRSGARSPGPYKLMPDIKESSPTDKEPPKSPPTALPQWPKAEQQKRFRKPSMNMFKGMLSKKNNQKQMSSGALGGNVALS